ncbi:MAG: hypothetical protein DHS20C14_07930 [Phycisphaeraceae bacterium]|nr:MAG: hypothetical protein DHS20C14_07930 [Phycisphaeraceae bacterium]
MFPAMGFRLHLIGIIVLLTGMTLTGAGIYCVLRRTKQTQPGYCDCGYDLHGLPDETCPECGRRIESH